MSRIYLFFVTLTAGICLNASLAEAQLRNDLFGRKPPQKVTLSAEFKVKPETRLGMLSLTANIIPDHQIYSTTQQSPGPRPSRIEVEKSDQFLVYGKFEPNMLPHVDSSREFFPVDIEHFDTKVIWSAPIQIADEVDIENLKIDLSYSGQVCEVDISGVSLNCDLLDKMKVQVKFAGFDPNLKTPEPPAEKKEVTLPVYQPDGHQVAFQGQVIRPDGIVAGLSAGEEIHLQVTAKLNDGFYIYANEQDKNFNATLFALTLPEGWTFSDSQASEKPIENTDGDYRAHKGEVTWSIPVRLPAEVTPSEYLIEGMIGFQNCNDQMCLRPDGAKFSTRVMVGGNSVPFPVTFEAGPSWGTVLRAVQDQNKRLQEADGQTGGSVAGTAATPEMIEEMAKLYQADSPIKYIRFDQMDQYPIGSFAASQAVPRQETGFFFAAGLIFLGGLLLNLMPCVFPVLGLKVMGFVEQAGSDPMKVRIHGLVFTMGLVFSMWVLAGIVLTLKMAFGQNVVWGAEQMSNPYFLAAIIVLLFLLGLNMAGVFEIGTSLTRVGGSVGGKKGYSASFMTGILTTLIATPCSGPFLGTAMTYTLSQSTLIAMVLFTVFAIGIAAPYLVFSFFPSLISMLPKPGAWMHTFKVIMSFALFATVAYFMQTFGILTGAAGLSWLIMALVIIGLAAFFYGNWSPAYVKPYKRVIMGWAAPLMVLAIGVWIISDAAGQVNRETSGDIQQGSVAWEKWYPGKVDYILENEPAIVWTDYTATWCPTCLFNKRRVFTDRAVLEKMTELGVRTVKVDFTSNDEKIALDMSRADQSIIPVNLIYPPNYPHEPAILFDGLVSPADALKVFQRMEDIQNMMAEAEKEAELARADSNDSDNLDNLDNLDHLDSLEKDAAAKQKLLIASQDNHA